jgi:hypothetical protein
MNWKDKRIKEINHDISETKKKYNFNLHGYYVEEYCDILSSKAKSFEEFKKERGVILVILNIIFR